MTKSATDWRAMYRRLGEETLALRQRAETAEQERDAALAERDRLRRLAEDLVDFVDHEARCVQAGKPLMETRIGGDIPCTCGLSALVNAIAEPASSEAD